MSRLKNKSRSETEYLKGECKRLKRENRALRRENKILKNKAHFYEETIDEVAKDIKLAEETCPKCKQGELIERDFNRIILKSCDTCDYKVRTKLRK